MLVFAFAGSEEGTADEKAGFRIWIPAGYALGLQDEDDNGMGRRVRLEGISSRRGDVGRCVFSDKGEGEGEEEEGIVGDGDWFEFNIFCSFFPRESF